MNCRDFEMNVLALAREGLLEAETRASSVAHAAGCTNCAERLEAERNLIAGVRAVVADMSAEAPARVEAALLTAFRQRAWTARATRIPRFPVSYWQRVAIAAACLALISTLAIVWLWVSSSNKRQQAVTMPFAPVNEQKLPDVAMRHETEIVDRAPGPRPHGGSHPRAVRHRAIQTEQLTEFFTLIEGIDLKSFEAAQIVRVKLPASALGDLGLPAGPEIRAGSIKADLLLGYDGGARAIRFVR